MKEYPQAPYSQGVLAAAYNLGRYNAGDEKAMAVIQSRQEEHLQAAMALGMDEMSARRKYGLWLV